VLGTVKSGTPHRSQLTASPPQTRQPGRLVHRGIPTGRRVSRQGSARNPIPQASPSGERQVQCPTRGREPPPGPMCVRHARTRRMCRPRRTRYAERHWWPVHWREEPRPQRPGRHRQAARRNPAHSGPLPASLQKCGPAEWSQPRCSCRHPSATRAGKAGDTRPFQQRAFHRSTAIYGRTPKCYELPAASATRRARILTACRHPALLMRCVIRSATTPPQGVAAGTQRYGTRNGMTRTLSSGELQDRLRSAGQSAQPARGPAARTWAEPASGAPGPGRGQACCNACPPARSPPR
jgi:hypothetical protein